MLSSKQRSLVVCCQEREEGRNVQEWTRRRTSFILITTFRRIHNLTPHVPITSSQTRKPETTFRNHVKHINHHPIIISSNSRQTHKQLRQERKTNTSIILIYTHTHTHTLKKNSTSISSKLLLFLLVPILLLPSKKHQTSLPLSS